MSEARRKNRTGYRCRGCGKLRARSAKEAIVMVAKGIDGRYCMACYVPRLKRRQKNTLPRGRTRPAFSGLVPRGEDIPFDRFFTETIKMYAEPMMNSLLELDAGRRIFIGGA